MDDFGLIGLTEILVVCRDITNFAVVDENVARSSVVRITVPNTQYLCGLRWLAGYGVN